MTLLDIVQKTLSAINSTNVNSITDTVEAEQVVLLAQTVHDRLLGEEPRQFLYVFGQLEITPIANEMKIPNNIVQLDWLKYDNRDVEYISIEEMVDKLDRRKVNAEANTDSNGAYTDRAPKYWSTLDGETIIFDGYDDGLVSAKTFCKMLRRPTTLTENASVPDLPERFHYVVLDGVLAEAFDTLKEDTARAAVYHQNYKLGKIKFERWARKVNKEASTYTNDFSRKGHGGWVRSVRVIEG